MTHTDLIASSYEFGKIVRHEVQNTKRWSDKEINDWLRYCLPKFGTPGWDWSRAGARDCARCFMDEAATW